MQTYTRRHGYHAKALTLLCSTPQPGVCSVRHVGTHQESVALGPLTGPPLTRSVSNTHRHLQRTRPCNALLLAESGVSIRPTVDRIAVASAPPVPQRRQAVDTVDVAVIGAAASGLAVALAVSKAQPGSSIALFDTAAGPPAPRDGGVLLSVNGLRSLRALDLELYNRLTTELASPVHEVLWFDLEGELVRRSQLGSPSIASATNSGGGGRKSYGLPGRRSTPPPAGRGEELDPSAPPLMVGQHELQEALSDALPPDVEIWGRHHLVSVEHPPSGGAVLRFAATPGGPPARTVHARLVVGADGADSALKRLKAIDSDATQQPQPSGRIVWRGRFKLRARDPDFARLRRFTTATRTWVDLRAPPGSQRSASLSPAGPGTYVWSASCPAGMLAMRGLEKTAAGVGGASPYWRCLAMFEDFPQEFFAALRATSASAVTETAAAQPPPAAVAAAALAAPWRWASRAAALVGEAVYGMSADDAASTAANLALEDAAVLGACLTAHGLSPRALQEYARQRGPRVSGLLRLPPSAPERLRLRNAPFIPTSLVRVPVASPADQVPTEAQGVGQSSQTAVNEGAAAAASLAPSSPVSKGPAAAAEPASSASVGVQSPGQRTVLPDLEGDAVAGTASIVPSRPAGGASRTTPPGSGAASGLPAFNPAGPASLLFSRPSGAMRLGPAPLVAVAAPAFHLHDNGREAPTGAEVSPPSDFTAASDRPIGVPAAAASAPDAAVLVHMRVPDQEQSAVPEPPQAPAPLSCCAATSGEPRSTRGWSAKPKAKGDATGTRRRSRKASTAQPTARSSFGSAAVGTTNASSQGCHTASGSGARAAVKAAAATVTVGLGAATALGGVIGASGGHGPVDVASALHVAQFWDELNALAMSSAGSLSSIDV